MSYNNKKRKGRVIMLYDCAVIGTGPAGLSAVLNLKIHEKSFVWFGSKNLSDKIEKAERISNYPGFYNVTGEALNAAFRRQAEEAGLEITELMVTKAVFAEDHWALFAGPEFYEAKTVILASGTAQTKTLPGETGFLGRGVSYCATCDGGLYRGRIIAVLCGNPRFEHEIDFLSGLAEKVYLFPYYKTRRAFAENVEIINKGVAEVLGDDRVNALRLTDGSVLAADALFCLREAVALTTLFDGLETENGHVKVDRAMHTNLPGVFAAGDCTGRPYQYAKAVGEGNVAAHSVIGMP